MLLNKKNRQYFLAIMLFLGTQLYCVANDLVIKLKNKTNAEISVKFIGSNESSKFEPIQILSGETKKLETDFSDDYFLNLLLENSNSAKIADIQVVNNQTHNNNFYIPGNGPLTNWGLAWSDDRIQINKIDGYKYYSWLSWFSWIPFISPEYHAEIDLQVMPPEEKISNLSNTSKVPLEFTLFAVPKHNKIKKIQLNATDEIEKKLCNDRLNLEYWDIKEYASLEPVVHEGYSGKMSRWVDLIIHNYSAKSFILYGLDEKPEDSHIEFSYKEDFIKDFTVFYPPQSQLRGPSFKFGVKHCGEKYDFYPETEKQDIEKDKFYLIIARQNNLSLNKLEYIPIHINTDIRLGRSLGSGVKVNAFEGYAYQVEFMPVNVKFYLTPVTSTEIAEKIRIPIDEDGQLAFKMTPMHDVKITAEAPSENSKEPQKNRVAQKYKISGKSMIDGKQYSYRLILVAPPFLDGNTPGIFSPGQRIPSSSDVGNFLRYPLHIYLMSLNNNGYEENIDGYETITELPENIMGSIEYFVSDKTSKN